MVIYPLVVAIVSGTFAGVVLSQYQRRRRQYQLTWAVALSLGFLAALFYILFLIAGHNAVVFKLYYICGALLMAAYLGMGSMYLLAPQRIATVALVGVVLLSLAGIVLLLTAATDAHRLAIAANVVGPGTNALRPGLWKALVAILNIFGSLGVGGGALYSAWRTARRQAPPRFLIANVLIAAGTFLAAAAGTAADSGIFVGAFWVTLALGFMVLFAGFVLTLPARVRVEPVTAEAVGR